MVSVRKRDAEGDKQDLGMMSLADFCGLLEEEGLSHPAKKPDGQLSWRKEWRRGMCSGSGRETWKGEKTGGQHEDHHL